MKEIRLCDDASVEKIFDLITENNLGIEIQGFYNPNIIGTQETEDLIEKYKKKLIDLKGGKSLHAPYWDLNLGSKTLLVKDATMKVFNYAYRVAKELGCTEIVVHNGFSPNTSYYDGWVKNAAAFWQEFFADKDDSITMMIENQNEEDSKVMIMEIDAVNDPRLKACLDIGHVQANSNMSIEDWIKTLNNRIGYLHFHNNHGKIAGRPSFLNDEHLGLDMGIIDIAKVFSLLEEYCPNAIWNIESRLEYLTRDVEFIQELGYLVKEKSNKM